MARRPSSGLSTPASREVEKLRAKTASDPVPTGLSEPDNDIHEELRSPLELRVEEILSKYERTHPLPQGCTKVGRQGITGYAVAGCATAGLDLGYR